MALDSRPQVWLVSPAWRRLAVTRLALAQRAHLAVELAARGIDCHTVIVADDDNLTVARDHGFHTVEMDNQEGLGRKFNAGFQYAADHGADWLVHIGSDDWIHPDAFTPLLDPELPPGRIVAGRSIAFVDLLSGRLRRAVLAGPTGVIPWIIPRTMLEPSGFAPIRPERYRGMDGFLVRGLRQSGVTAKWIFYDPHSLARVDFKSDVNINTYHRLPEALGLESEESPWTALAEHYPQHLVDLARETHFQLPGGQVPKMLNPKGRLVSVSHAGVGALLKRGYTFADDTPVETPPPATYPGETAVPEDLQEAPPAVDAAPPEQAGAPLASALKADWVAYATAQGLENADKLTKPELIKRFG